MDLPIMPYLAPMLAKAVEDIPTGEYGYEPKWDGFRAIVFRDRRRRRDRQPQRRGR